MAVPQWQFIVDSHVLFIIVALLPSHISPVLPDLRIHLLQVVVRLDMKVSLQVCYQICMPICVQFGVHSPHETYLRFPHTLLNLKDVGNAVILAQNAMFNLQKLMFFLHHFAELLSLRWHKILITRHDIRMDAHTFIDGILPSLGGIEHRFIGLTRSRGSQSYHINGLPYLLFLRRVMYKWRQYLLRRHLDTPKHNIIMIMIVKLHSFLQQYNKSFKIMQFIRRRFPVIINKQSQFRQTIIFMESHLLLQTLDSHLEVKYSLSD